MEGSRCHIYILSRISDCRRLEMWQRFLLIECWDSEVWQQVPSFSKFLGLGSLATSAFFFKIFGTRKFGNKCLLFQNFWDSEVWQQVPSFSKFLGLGSLATSAFFFKILLEAFNLEAMAEMCHGKHR